MRQLPALLFLGTILISSLSCNPFRNLGKSKEERRQLRKEQKAERLINRAKNINPEILKPDTITIDAERVDSFLQMDTVISFVDSIVNRFIHIVDNSRGNTSGTNQIDLDALRAWAIKELKDSIRNRILLKDTAIHVFQRNGVEYLLKFWQENNQIKYQVDRGKQIIADQDIVIKQRTWWGKNQWWLSILSILLVLFILWRIIKKLLKL